MMTTLTLIFKSMIHYRRSNMLLFLGAALACTIISGALILGDSVNHSLNKISQSRIGKIQWIVQGGSSFFRSSLSQSIDQVLDCQSAPIIYLPVIASSQGGQQRSNNSHLIGIDHDFFAFSPAGQPITIKPGQALINAKLAQKLNLTVNDEVTVFIKSPSGLPSDAPFSTGHEEITLKLTVIQIIDKSNFSDFSLNINPLVPSNIMVNSTYLAGKLNQPKRANHLLVSNPKNKNLTSFQLQQVLEQHWQLEDTPLLLQKLPNQNLIELRSTDVFLPPLITSQLQQAFPKAIPIFTYFINSLSHGQLSTPYSMVSSLPSSQPELKDHEISISKWLAKDLKATIGDQLDLTYYVITPNRQLETKTSTFTVRSTYPLNSLVNGRSLMPDFPGLSDTGNCRDWTPGIPVDLNQIRDKDEEYWDRYGGTPKAFINLNKAQTCWGNQFGELTALRFKSSDPNTLRQSIAPLIKPRLFGVQLIDIKSQSLQSTQESIDFSELFLGLSFFMVIASLILLTMFFNYYIDSRQSDIKTLQALGFTHAMIKKLFFSEGLIIALAGSLLGILVSIIYNHALLAGLATIWFNAVRTTELVVHLKPITLISGFFISVLFAGCSIFLSLKNMFNLSITTQTSLNRIKQASPWLQWLNGGLFVLIILSTIYLLASQTSYSILLFIGLAMLLLANGLLFVYIILTTIATMDPQSNLSIWSVSINNLTRRMKASLGLIALLALGLFMIISVSANRQNESINAQKRHSGTGGYSLFAQATYPLTQDLNTLKGKKRYGLDKHLFKNTTFVQMRLQPGNDASCLNINRTLTPNILGLNPTAFIEHKAFTFSKILKGYEKLASNPWQLLQTPLDGQVPTIADQTVIQYGLGKKVGESIRVTNDQGQPIDLLLVASLANSIFQGHVIISDNNFLSHFPSNEGTQVFLVDQSTDPTNQIQQALSRALIKYGVEITATAKRLAEFNTVQNTYLSIFLLLGGLGLMISTLGLAILLARHILERRGELALLAAIGYTKKMIKQLILSEYMVLLFSGIIIGTISGLIAVIPVIAVPGSRVPFDLILLILLAISFTGVASIEVVTNHLLKKNLIQGLRED